MNFLDVCAECGIWIIEYSSAAFLSSIYLVNYSDDSRDSKEQDGLLLISDKVFAVSDLRALRGELIKNRSHLSSLPNIEVWINSMLELEVEVYHKYDAISMCIAIAERKFDDNNVELIADFISLFGDFVYQSSAHHKYRNDLEAEAINEIWTDYYTYIFWPRFNDPVKYSIWEKPDYTANYDGEKILIEFKNIMQILESKICLVDHN